MTLRNHATTFSALFALSVAAAAQTTAGPEEVGRSFVMAVRSGSSLRRVELLHPKSRACITDRQTEQYFAWIFSRQMKYVIDPVKLSVKARALPEGQLEYAQYSVRPTHQVEVDFESWPGTSTTVVLLAAPEGGRWYEVLPCPSADTLARFQQAAEERAAQEVSAPQGVVGLPAAVRSEVIQLLKAGGCVDAIRRLAATGIDLAVARRMIDIVEARAGMRPPPLLVADARQQVPVPDPPGSRPAMDIVIREIERMPRVSVLNLDIRSTGSSVGSSFFMLCSIRRLAGLRGDYRYAAMIESQGRQSQTLVGFLEYREEGLGVLGPEFGMLKSPKDVIDLEEFAPICDRMR